MCGEKAASGVIGVNQDTIYEDCNSMEGNEIQSILHSAVQQGIPVPAYNYMFISIRASQIVQVTQKPKSVVTCGGGIV